MASEFCVETAILQGARGKQRVIGSNLTLFSEHNVYDFSGWPAKETLVFDKPRKVLVVMDPQRRVQCELNFAAMLKLNKTLNSYASGRRDALKRFCSDPKFERHVDPQSRRLRLESQPLSYFLEGFKPTDVEAVQRYRDFADWSARLNAIRSGLPANARLAVNRELAQMALLPNHVTKKSSDRAEPLSSTHKYRWDLSDADKKQMRLADSNQLKFRKIAPEGFFLPK